MLGVFKHGIAETVADHVGRRAARGQGVGDQNCPVCSSRRKRASRWDPGRIVAPGRQAEFVAFSAHV